MDSYTPDMNSQYRRYAALLLRQHRLLVPGQEKGSEMDETENELGQVWDTLDPCQRQSLSGLGSDLTWVETHCQPPPRGRSADAVTEQEYRTLDRAWREGDWHRTLHYLRLCAPGMDDFDVAYLRARLWHMLGFADLARVFDDLALELYHSPMRGKRRGSPG